MGDSPGLGDRDWWRILEVHDMDVRADLALHHLVLLFGPLDTGADTVVEGTMAHVAGGR